MSSKPFLAQASAPGKVLILGGYLIVVSPNVGISIGVNARFTTRVIEAVQLSPLATATVETIVHVASPQFHQNYTFHVHGTAASTPADEVLTIEQIEGPPSGFLKYAILYAVAASRVKDKNVNYDIHMELLADNDFYSQRNYLESAGQEVNVVNLRGLPKHLPLVGSVSKTGLGSSAAMTTSVVAGLYTFFQQNVPETIELVHRIAQIAHSVAQGKIGSGFDVFTAVFGTCAYRRFPASKVEMMVEAAGEGEVQSVPVTQLAKCIALTEEWVANVPFQLPAGIHLVLGDVHKGGSGTPGMVSKIMAWREAVMEKEDNLWRRLQSSNEDYLSQLRDLLSQAHNNPTGHMHAVEALSQTPNLAEYEPTDDMERTFVNAARAAAQCRGQLRSMGVAAGVKIEPEELTDMLDATAALPGVFAVGCPGAGGYDAIFALVVGTAETRARVEKFWESYESLHVCPLLVEEDPKGLVMEL